MPSFSSLCASTHLTQRAIAGSLLGFIALLCAAEPAAPRRLRAGLLCGVILNATVFTRTRSHAQDSFFEDRR